MMNHLLKISLFLPVLVFGIRHREAENILMLYQGKYDELSKYYENIQNYLIPVFNYNPCLDFVKSNLDMPRKAYDVIDTEIISGSELEMMVTLDGVNYFTLPAIIKCNLLSLDGVSLNLFLIIAKKREDKENSYDLLRVFENLIYSDKIIFESNNVINRRIVANTYEGNFDEMEFWYMNIQNSPDIRNICKTLQTISNPHLELYKIESENIVIGNYTLYYDYKYYTQCVQIPGYLECTVEFDPSYVVETKYYVKVNSLGQWMQIFNISTDQGGLIFTLP